MSSRKREYNIPGQCDNSDAEDHIFADFVVATPDAGIGPWIAEKLEEWSSESNIEDWTIPLSELLVNGPGLSFDDGKPIWNFANIYYLLNESWSSGVNFSKFSSDPEKSLELLLRMKEIREHGCKVGPALADNLILDCARCCIEVLQTFGIARSNRLRKIYKEFLKYGSTKGELNGREDLHESAGQSGLDDLIDQLLNPEDSGKDEVAPLVKNKPQDPPKTGLPIRKADVVFAIDRSASMEPTFYELKKNITSFIDGLNESGDAEWDIRYDFLAHTCQETNGVPAFTARSIFHPDLGSLFAALYQSTFPELFLGHEVEPKLFAKDINHLSASLSELKASSDEASLFGLDCALDMPWRSDSECHRIIIMLTDEPFETGVFKEEQQEKLPDLKRRVLNLGVELFVFAPECPTFMQLATIPKSVVKPLPWTNDGMADVDFADVLALVGRTVSSSRSNKLKKHDIKPLFGQETCKAWGEQTITGGDEK